MSKILVIEDDFSIRDNIVKILEITGYDVVEASDGTLGVQTFMAEKPDLVICDIMMAGMDGYEVLKAVRKIKTQTNIPFIFLTAKTEKTDLREGMNLGADDYLTKPFLVDELISTVQGRLERSQAIKQEINSKVEETITGINRIVSHEYRTPLSGILGASDLLYNHLDELSRDDTMDLLSAIQQSGKRLQRVTTNVILYAHLQKLTTPLEDASKALSKEPLNTYNNLLQALIEEETTALNRHVKVSLASLNMPLYIMGDHFKTIFGELIDNALKFSPIDSLLKIWSVPIGNYLRFSISNEGRGMAEKEIAAIAPFTQFNRNKYEQQGMGLGLYIAQRLTLLHNGKFEIESIADGITTVHVHLPFTQLN